MRPPDFNAMVDAFFKKEQKKKDIGRYYPSEIGSCLRKVWYSYKEPVEFAPAQIKIFELGNIMHDFIAKVLKSDKNPHVELLKEEFPFKEEIDGFVISGRIDDLIMLKADGTQLLVEVKSTKSIGYVNEASPAHESQLQLYMHFLGVHDGVVLYVDKTNLQTKWFPVKYGEGKAKDVINRFKALHKCLVNDVLPIPEARASAKTLWMCRFCEYNDKCYSATPKSKEWP